MANFVEESLKYCSLWLIEILGWNNSVPLSTLIEQDVNGYKASTQSLARCYDGMI